MRRRWIAATGAAIIVIAGAGSVYLYFRAYEPDRSRFPVRGVDVSHHQGVIDWAAVAGDDVAFAYIKASEGGDYRDREYQRNIAEANRRGLPVGAYHFFTFCRPAADQAQNFVGAVLAGATQLPPVVDLEFHGNCDRRPSPDEMRREVEAFVDEVETRLGQTLIYYAPDEFLDVYGDVLPPRSLWRRSILREPDRSDWVIWQYHQAGRVAGIDGDVDLDVLSVGIEDLTETGKTRRSPAGAPAQ